MSPQTHVSPQAQLSRAPSKPTPHPGTAALDHWIPRQGARLTLPSAGRPSRGHRGQANLSSSGWPHRRPGARWLLWPAEASLGPRDLPRVGQPTLCGEEAWLSGCCRNTPFPRKRPWVTALLPEKPAQTPGGGWGGSRVGTGPSGPWWGSLTARTAAPSPPLPAKPPRRVLQTALGAHTPATVLRTHLQLLWLLLALQSLAGALAGLRPPAAHCPPEKSLPGSHLAPPAPSLGAAHWEGARL